MNTPCPCGSQQAYPLCCGQYIDGQATPTTPEQLMRSRYTAFTQANIDYLAKSMRPPASNDFDITSTKQWAANVHWQQLNILQSSQQGDKGQVEFIAHFSESGMPRTIHELSEFHRINGTWYYVSGTLPEQRPIVNAKRPGRNELCLCGSGKKFKKCCGVS